MTKAHIEKELALSHTALARLTAELEDAKAELSLLGDSYLALASHDEANIDKNLRLCAVAERLSAENGEQQRQIAQLQSNLATFRDRCKARVSELSMEARFWGLDIAELLKA
jgi:hypothetical protein